MASVGFRSFDRKFIGHKMADGRYQFKYFFDRELVLTTVIQQNQRILARTGSAVRRAVRDSMKKSTRKARSLRAKQLAKETGFKWRVKDVKADTITSAPGDPPAIHTGLLHNHIYFGYEPATQSVVIGPVRFDSAHTRASGGMTGAELLEKGGMAHFSWKFRKGSAYVQARPYMAPQMEYAIDRYRTNLRREGLTGGFGTLS